MGKKIYFSSDVHLGLPPASNARQRELAFVAWLNSIQADAEAVFLLGDIFDFWFEYKMVAPRGFVRTLGKLAEMTDNGIPVHFFVGNHDLWVTDYLTSETGVQLHTSSLVTDLHGRRFFLAHGDAEDFTDKKHQAIRRIFTNPCLRALYAALHPRIALWVAHRWSHQNRKQKVIAEPFNEEEEGLYQFAQKEAVRQGIDYFIFGHRHCQLSMPVEGTGASINILGEWISGCAQFAVFDGENLQLESISY